MNTVTCNFNIYESDLTIYTFESAQARCISVESAS